tara:strand:- start:579 stop:1325 length:747 start_codon:yes stop_codon:yes gene_type:complete
MNLYFYISKIFYPLIIPSNIFIFSLILFFYFGFIKNKNLSKKIFVCTFLIFSMISVLPVGHYLIYFFLEKNYYNSKVPSKLDYIFVPSGSINRVITAINIKNNYNLDVVKIIYSSGIPYLDEKNSQDTEAYFVKDIILNSKINENEIIFLDNARNTYENFKRLNEFLIKTNNINSKILLITDAYHMKRSMILSKKYNLNISSFPSDFITKNETKGFINSYQSINVQNNLKKFDVFIKELISTTISTIL